MSENMSEKTRNTVAEKLAAKRRRENRKIPQRKAAEESGVPFSTLARWYRNDVEIYDGQTLLKFARYFGCDISELLVVEEVPDDPDPTQHNARLSAPA